MTLEESGPSTIDDSETLKLLRTEMYAGSDPRPTWIGERRAASNDKSAADIVNWASTHYDFYLNFVRDDMERRGAVLDIGCGAGQYAAMLARYSQFVIGLDSDERAIKFASQYNSAPTIRFVHDRFPADQISGPFDYIFCVETIEHVINALQVEFIAAALGLLAPDGRLFLTTPNEQSSGGGHVGIWSTEWNGKIAERFAANIVRRGYFSNSHPGLGMIPTESSHYAVVMKP